MAPHSSPLPLFVMPSSSLTATALSASFASYLFLKRYEPTDPWLLAAFLLVPPLIVAYFQEELDVLRSILYSYSLYYFGLSAWIVTYRTSPLHPLSRYPGPVACKISKLWLTFVGSRGKLHQYVKELHDKHGPVIRIGPNELSISDVGLLSSILGSDGMPKGPLWDGRVILSMNRKSAAAKEAARGQLINTRDPEVHAKSRKNWNRAFIPAAIKGYEPMLIRRVAQLVEALGAGTDTSVDLSQWLSFFSFDFMGDIAFGGGFELMRDGDRNGLWHILERGLYLPALTQQIPWVVDFISYFSMVGKKERDALQKFALNQATRRLQEGAIHNDLFYYLMDKKGADDKPMPLPLVVSNALLAIIAGADTSATVLSNTFFLLLSHPESYERLQSEIDSVFPLGGKEPTDTALLSSLPYLNAVIRESLRLFPPVATSLQRAPTVGTGSKVLGENFVIPEGTSVVVPPYTIHRDPRNFSPNPDKYIPDRWLAKDDDLKFVTNDDAFIPFSSGPANCVGKNLAMLEIRMVVVYIMQAFKLQFSDGYDTYRWEHDLKDYFVMQKGSLPVNLTCRTA
ncbi:cytochrome P450 [Mycena sanguinolenta]|nr:cytochrome P450 [Mycena sanguinolenta]